jgi:heme/copper-type cytochrome/quinol oxidase subunit 2
MKAQVEVVSQQDFDKWYQEKVKPPPAPSPAPKQPEQKTSK